MLSCLKCFFRFDDASALMLQRKSPGLQMKYGLHSGSPQVNCCVIDVIN